MEINKTTIAKSFFWKLLERFSVQFVSLGITLVLARILGPDDYGIIALITVFISLSNVIIDGGLNTALIQKKNADNRDFSTIFWGSLGLATILYTIVFVISPFVASYYNNNDITLVLRIYAIAIFLESINSIQRAYVSKNMLFRKLFYSSLIAIVISGIIGVVLALNHYGVWALVFQSIALHLVTTITLWVTVRWRPECFFSFERFKALFNFGWKIFGINFLTSLYLNIRVLIIGKAYTPATLAFFEKGHSLTSLIMQNINTSLQTVIFPALSAEQDNLDRVKQMVKRSSSLSSFFIFPILVGMIVIAKPLVILLLTEKWLPAVPFIQIFSIAYLLFPMQVANMEAIKAIGLGGTSLKIEIFKKIIETMILVISVLINEYAIAWGVVVFNFLCLFINLYPSVKYLHYGIKEQVSDVISPLLISITMGAIIYFLSFLPLSNFVLLTSQVILGAIIYAVLNLLFKTQCTKYLLSFIKK